MLPDHASAQYEPWIRRRILTYITHGENSKSIMTSQPKLPKNIGFEEISEDNGKMSRPTGIVLEKKIICTTRRRDKKGQVF